MIMIITTTITKTTTEDDDDYNYNDIKKWKIHQIIMDIFLKLALFLLLQAVG